MPEHLAIITGASRGLGAALAHELLDHGHALLGISRHSNAALDALARERGVTCEQWRADLADAVPLADRLESWLRDVDPARFDHVALVNNAAALARIGPLKDSEPGDLVHALRVGLEAPMLLTAAFLRGTSTWHARQHDGACKILNISSGLGRRAMASQAAYCAVKAAMDHWTRCVALEQAHEADPVKIVSLAPGVIATDMQVALRSADAGDFPDRARFLALEAQGQLDAPDAAARKLVAWLARAEFGHEPVADIRDP